jgi:hypothetical protein
VNEGGNREGRGELTLTNNTKYMVLWGKSVWWVTFLIGVNEKAAFSKIWCLVVLFLFRFKMFSRFYF